MPRPHLRTARIDLVPMTPEHLPELVRLDADPEVMRHLLGRARTEAEVHDFWGPVCADTEADAVGLGWWVGWSRATGDFLGWWDLSPRRPVDLRPAEAEAGWRLVRRHWHRGYATEGATAVLDHGFGTVGLETVWAETMAVNTASRAVMDRLGMRHVRTEHRSWEHPLPGADPGEVVHELTAGEWAARGPGRPASPPGTGGVPRDQSS